MKNIITLLILTFISTSFGQNIKKPELIGKWTTKNITIDFKDAKPKSQKVIEGLKKGFLNSEFDFKENGKFYLKLPNDRPAFMEELTSLNDKNWKLKNNQIKLGTDENNLNLMFIKIKKINGKVFFVIPGMKLEMVKG